MTPPVSIQELRVQVRLEADDDSQDIDLQPKLLAAIRAVENETGRTFAGVEPRIDEADLPAAKVAVLLLAGHWYRNREAVTVGTAGSDLPMGVKLLLNPLAKMGI